MKTRVRSFFARYLIFAIALLIGIIPIKVDAAVPSSQEILAEVPAYTGQPYVMLNSNVPYFLPSEISAKSFEYYSNLDQLGRCGSAWACVGKDIMPTEKRGEIGMVKPTGWHTVKYAGYVDGNYLYNRCHLLGYQLTGENANEKNLITGTRYLNVVGMLTLENMVANYVKSTDNHVMYRVTPVFDKNNLLANGVVMEGYSVEDGGKGICFNVFAYNVQPGIVINYSTGDSVLAAEVMPGNQNRQNNDQSGQKITSTGANTTASYILNINTKKFHIPSCSSVGKMSEKNKEYYTGDRSAVINRGFVPCKICCP